MRFHSLVYVGVNLLGVVLLSATTRNNDSVVFLLRTIRVAYAAQEEPGGFKEKSAGASEPRPALPKKQKAYRPLRSDSPFRGDVTSSGTATRVRFREPVAEQAEDDGNRGVGQQASDDETVAGKPQAPHLPQKQKAYRRGGRRSRPGRSSSTADTASGTASQVRSGESVGHGAEEAESRESRSKEAQKEHRAPASRGRPALPEKQKAYRPLRSDSPFREDVTSSDTARRVRFLEPFTERRDDSEKGDGGEASSQQAAAEVPQTPRLPRRKKGYRRRPGIPFSAFSTAGGPAADQVRSGEPVGHGGDEGAERQTGDRESPREREAPPSRGRPAQKARGQLRSDSPFRGDLTSSDTARRVRFREPVRDAGDDSDNGSPDGRSVRAAPSTPNGHSLLLQALHKRQARSLSPIPERKEESAEVGGERQRRSSVPSSGGGGDESSSLRNILRDLLANTPRRVQNQPGSGHPALPTPVSRTSSSHERGQEQQGARSTTPAGGMQVASRSHASKPGPTWVPLQGPTELSRKASSRVSEPGASTPVYETMLGRRPSFSTSQPLLSYGSPAMRPRATSPAPSREPVPVVYETMLPQLPPSAFTSGLLRSQSLQGHPARMPSAGPAAAGRATSFPRSRSMSPGMPRRSPSLLQSAAMPQRGAQAMPQRGRAVVRVHGPQTIHFSG